jgi:outer membrane protein assembly factor BamB
LQIPSIARLSLAPATQAPTRPATAEDRPAAVDLRAAARLVLSPHPTGVQRRWTVAAQIIGSPVRGPEGETYLARTYPTKSLDRIDPSDGHTVWSCPSGLGPRTPPLLSPDGRAILFGGRDNRVHAVEPKTGAELWQLDVPCEQGGFVGGDGLVYFRDGDRIRGIDPARKAVVTETPLSGKDAEGNRVAWFEAHPTIARDGTVYGGGKNGELYALEPGTGRVKWHAQSGGMLRNSPAVGKDGSVFAGCVGKAMVGFTPDGREKWRFPTPHWIMADPVVADDGTVLVGCDNHTLYAVDPENGDKRWSFEMDGAVRVEPTPAADGVLYAVSDRNTLYGIDSSSGTELWQTAAPSYVHCPITPDGESRFMFESNDGTIVAMEDGTATLRSEVEHLATETRTAEAPHTIEREDGWIVVDGVRLPRHPSSAPS